MNQERQIIHLFSSDARELYIQDCIDLLALPKGATLRFRYAENYLEESEKIRNSAQGEIVFTYFVSQKREDPTELLIVPLRQCKLIRVTNKDKFIFLDLQIGDYLSVGQVSEILDFDEKIILNDGLSISEVSKFTENLQLQLGNIPHKEKLEMKWNTSGKSGVIRSNDKITTFRNNQDLENKKFKDTSDILFELTKNTNNFSPDFKIESLYQISEVKVLGGEKADVRVTVKSEKTVPFKNGYTFESRVKYAIEILQFKTTTDRSPVLKFEQSDLLNATTPTLVSLASNYDYLRFEFTAKPRDDEAQSYISFTLDSNDSTKREKGYIYPKLSLPISVVPPGILKEKSRRAIWGSTIIAGLFTFSSAKNLSFNFSNQEHFGRHRIDHISWPVWLLEHTPSVVIGGIAMYAAYTTASFAFQRRSIGLKD